jgi:hypothetical protein
MLQGVSPALAIRPARCGLLPLPAGLGGYCRRYDEDSVPGSASPTRRLVLLRLR